MRPVRVLIAASVAALALAAPAGAVPPQHEQETLVLGANPTDNPVIDCPNGHVLFATVTLTRRVTTYFDANGERLRQVRHFQFTGTLYSDDLSRSSPYWGHARRELDYRTNTVTLTGRRLVLPLPGQGAAKTGREELDATTFDIHWESGHTLAGFEAAACAALYPHA
jgi:hypothetical protein